MSGEERRPPKQNQLERGTQTLDRDRPKGLVGLPAAIRSGQCRMADHPPGVALASQNAFRQTVVYESPPDDTDVIPWRSPIDLPRLALTIICLFDPEEGLAQAE